MILNNFLFFFKNHICDWVKKRIVEEEMSRWREKEEEEMETRTLIYVVVVRRERV